jgi:tetratricopeptide (TPR) repeat protein
MRRAFRDHSLPVEDRILLADLFESRGDKEKSLSLLLQIFETGSVTADLCYRIAQLSAELNRIGEGYRLFQKQVANPPNSGFLFGWALLATISGRSADVYRRLSDYSGPTNAQYLKDLYFSVPIESIPELALLCAQKLHNEYPSREHRSMLMTALLNSGNPQEVIQLIHQIEDRSSRENEIYQTALTTAFQNGLPVEQELAQFWIDQLENPNQESEDVEEAVHALIKLKKYSEISGTIETLAEQNPRKWLYVFEEVIRETGEKTGFTWFFP